MTRINEHAEQAAFVGMVKMFYRDDPTFISKLFFAVPNGAWLGGKSFAMYQKLQSEGVQNGVSDLLYLQPRGDFAFLAIEMKAPDKKNKLGALSPDQMEFLDAVIKVGGRASVCYSADEAINIFKLYMGYNPKEKEEA